MTMVLIRTNQKRIMLKVMRVMVGLAAGPKCEAILCPVILPLRDLTDPLLGFLLTLVLEAPDLLQARRTMKKTRAERAMRQ